MKKLKIALCVIPFDKNKICKIKKKNMKKLQIALCVIPFDK